MTYYEVSLKLQHDCPVNEFVKKHPSAVIAWWCNHSNDVLEISRDELNDEGFDYDLELMLGAVGAKSIRRTSTDSKIQIVSRCSCFRWPQSTAFLFEKHNCLEVYPAIFTDGS
jgi:predicted DNA binding protein